jgi:hypothetical protein
MEELQQDLDTLSQFCVSWNDEDDSLSVSVSGINLVAHPDLLCVMSSLRPLELGTAQATIVCIVRHAVIVRRGHAKQSKQKVPLMAQSLR